MKLDIDSLAATLAADPQVALAFLFGSAQNGTVRDGGDVDIGVLLSPVPTPLEFYTFYKKVASRLPGIDDLDLVDLSRANSVLAFEAIRGKRLVVRDPEAAAGFVSLTARQYEDDMLHTASRHEALP